METLATYIDAKNPNIRALIIEDYDSESPRLWDNTCLFHFKDDRTYKLPQEAEDIIDWQYHELESEYDDEECKQERKEYFEKLNNEYYLFGMYYANYSYAWPLFFKQCDIDDEKMIGLALVKKQDIEHDYCLAKSSFSCELETYQQYNEWEIFGVQIQKLQTWTNEETKETKQEWETIDSCYGFYGTSYEKTIKENFNFSLDTKN